LDILTRRAEQLHNATVRRGCMWVLGVLIGTLLLVSALAGIGIMVGARQPGQLWIVSVGQSYFAIGRLVNQECRRLQARGTPVHCVRDYGAVLYLPHTGAGGYGVEYTLFAIPDPWPPG
jgi:hypothetical protein